jgi:hypothetical protein
MNFNNIITLYKNCYLYPPTYNDNLYLFKINNNLLYKIDPNVAHLYHINAVIYTSVFMCGILTYLSLIIFN